jgi:hypothetical protein
MADTSYNPGTYGQTKSSWRDPHHLRGLLLKLVKLHPDLDIRGKEFAELYLAEAKGKKFRASAQHEAFIDEVLRYKLDNDVKALEDNQNERRRKRPRTKPTAAEVAAADQRLKDIVLMELMTPIGKPYGDCNGKELLGGWHIQVADRIGDRGVVRKKLTEQKLINIRDGVVTPPPPGK